MKKMSWAGAAALAMCVASAGRAAQVDGFLWPTRAERAAAARGVEGEFGAAVALDGDVAFVGAPRSLEGGVRSGAVHAAARTQDGDWYAAPGSPWTVSWLGAGARFGAAVAADGGLLVVGAPGADGTGGPASGEVVAYRFDRRSGRVLAESRLAPPPGYAGAGFGAALSIDARPGRPARLAVGAPTLGSSGPNGLVPAAGAVLIYAWRNEAWHLVRTLRAPRPTTAATFGFSLQFTDDLLVVGAPGDGVAAPGAGRVFGFDGEGSLVWELAPISEPAGARYGTSLASLDARQLAVGVPGRGVVEIVRCVDGGIDHATLLRGETLGWFGASLASLGSRLFVGAPTSGPSGCGRVECFSHASGAWARCRPILPEPPTSEGSFGSALAALPSSDSGGRLIVGEPRSAHACRVSAADCHAGRALVLTVP
ncbi:MAG: hypothetical protein AAF726_05755 [Planctomycetota bacterium]